MQGTFTKHFKMRNEQNIFFSFLLIWYRGDSLQDLNDIQESSVNGSAAFSFSRMERKDGLLGMVYDSVCMSVSMASSKAFLWRNNK